MVAESSGRDGASRHPALSLQAVCVSSLRAYCCLLPPEELLEPPPEFFDPPSECCGDDEPPDVLLEPPRRSELPVRSFFPPRSVLPERSLRVRVDSRTLVRDSCPRTEREPLRTLISSCRVPWPWLTRVRDVVSLA